MESYINPQIFIPLNPVGLDKEIAVLQQRIFDSLLIEKVFGRAYLQKDSIKSLDQERVTDNEIMAPYCYLKNQEPINVMPNDNIISQVFFFPRESERLTDEGVLANIIFSTVRVSLIVWGDFIKMNVSSPEYVKMRIISILKTHPSLKITEVFEAFDSVFDKFTLTDQMINYNKFPYFAIRADFDLSYEILPENC